MTRRSSLAVTSERKKTSKNSSRRGSYVSSSVLKKSAKSRKSKSKTDLPDFGAEFLDLNGLNSDNCDEFGSGLLNYGLTKYGSKSSISTNSPPNGEKHVKFSED